MPTMDTPTLAPFKSLHYAGRSAGPSLIVTGAVHGNEVCGTRAIERLATELDAGRRVLARGRLTLVPVCNALAYAHGRRAGERNLNRALGPSAAPQQFEDHVANWLCPLLRQHEVLLDLHSYQAGTQPGAQPFVMVGPRNNHGPVEPFTQAADEEAWVRVLGVRRAVDGWLSTYAQAVQRRREALPAGTPTAGLDLQPHYGVGTTEYMRAHGGRALTLECGGHDDPASIEVAWNALLNTLAHLGLVDAPAPTPVAPIEALSLFDVVDKAHQDDRFVRDWKSFEPLREGELIGVRANGSEVRAEAEGCIVFPNPKAGARQEWFYLARPSARF